MKSIISIALLFVAFSLYSCNSNQSLKGKTYYLLYISDDLVSEHELHFLSEQDVTIRHTLFATKGVKEDYRDDGSYIFLDKNKVQKYWINDTVLEVPESQLRIRLGNYENSIIGISNKHTLLGVEGLVYASSILDHINDAEVLQRIRNVILDEKYTQYYLNILIGKAKVKSNIDTNYAGTTEQAIKSFVQYHPDFYKPKISDFDAANLKFLNEEYKVQDPYLRTGDFNKDGFKDFAVLLGMKSKKDERCLVVFNGNGNSSYRIAELLYDDSPMSSFYYEENVNNSLCIVPNENSFFIMAVETRLCADIKPVKEGYRITPCPEAEDDNTTLKETKSKILFPVVQSPSQINKQSSQTEFEDDNVYESKPESGISHSLDDRIMIAKPRPDAEFEEGGKVVIRITINKEGEVTNKRIKSAANAKLAKIALIKAAEIRFSKNEQAPREQFGDITFNFKTRASK